MATFCQVKQTENRNTTWVRRCMTVNPWFLDTLRIRSLLWGVQLNFPVAGRTGRFCSEPLMHEMPCSLQHWWLTWRGTLLSAHNLIVSYGAMLTEQPQLHQISPLQTEQKAPPHPLVTFILIQLTLSFSRPWRFPWPSLLFFLLISLSLRTSTLSKHCHLRAAGWVIKMIKILQDMSVLYYGT